MRYEEALGWLYARQRFGIKQGLDNMARLLAALEDPQKGFDAFHVTGSNGKGSVSAFLDEALRSTHSDVGRYVSPHLTTFTERVTVGGREIPRSEVALLTEQLVPVVEGLEREGARATFFEVVTALAFLYFRRRRIKVAVVEVGMGGRWDATNLVRPAACVITNVGLEHTDRLGSTVGAIAAEKAGILKPGAPAVTRAVGEAYDVVRRRAREVGAALRFVSAPDATESLDGTRCTLTYQGAPVDVKLGLLGRHQAENAALAAAALEATPAWAPTPDRLVAALAKTRWPGRLEPVSQGPLVLLDGAHNAPACEVLAGFIERVVRPRRTHAVFGALRDKNVPGMVRALAPAIDRWVVTAVPNERGLPPEQVAATLRDEGRPAAIETDTVEAIRLLHAEAAPEDVLFVTGSLFLVGAARAALLKTETDPPVPHAILQ
ncbi:MAG: bifunctional folylpolyglutamate synthase/dihydrofolate synthase [Euryarchaeota archaeon]|nr:bifunctional folylpolyglutamate synthase/dihydrofolate synthase [Euryarchaeota archaeon]